MNNTVCIGTGTADRIKEFSDSVLPALSNETFQHVMIQFLLMACRLHVKALPIIENLDNEPLLITQPNVMDDDSPLTTQPDPMVTPHYEEENESYTVYETKQKPLKSRGIKYPKLFLTDVGNFHTGIHVIDTFPDREIVNEQWLHFDIVHQKQNKGELGFQLYLSPLKNISGKFEYQY